MLKSSLYDKTDTHIHAKGTITVAKVTEEH